MKAKICTSLLLVFTVAFSLSAGQLCGRWDTEVVNNHEYVVQNNIWGATTSQCIDVNGNSFKVTSASHNLSPSGSPASYPSIFKGCHWEDCTSNSGMPVQVSQIRNATIDWKTSLNSTGNWNVTSEAWFRTNSNPGEPDGAELMIWMNHAGSVQPGGSQIGSVNIGGYNWEVWFASIGWNFITYRITTPRDSLVIDYRPFIDDAISRGYIQNHWYMMDIEAGFEIWSGGSGLSLDSFTAAINQGPVATPTPTPTPTPQNQPLGDVNRDNKISIVDALQIAQSCVGIVPGNFASERADVNCDGRISIIDALVVAQYAVGVINHFC